MKFYDLEQKLIYKAKQNQSIVIEVDSRYTSQCCPMCGHTDLKTNQGILVLLLMYSVLEFMGAISFDSMYSPLILARTGNNEMKVGIISAFMAAGCLAASIMLTVMKLPKRKLSMMYLGSFMCLTGITLFGMGRNIGEWCAIGLFGCFGVPIYSTYQTVILREKVLALD